MIGEVYLLLQNSNAPFDIRFAAQYRREEIHRSDSNAAAGSMSVAVRIKLEKLKAESEDIALLVREKQVVFINTYSIIFAM